MLRVCFPLQLNPITSISASRRYSMLKYWVPLHFKFMFKVWLDSDKPTWVRLGKDHMLA